MPLNGINDNFIHLYVLCGGSCHTAQCLGSLRRPLSGWARLAAHCIGLRGLHSVSQKHPDSAFGLQVLPQGILGPAKANGGGGGPSGLWRFPKVLCRRTLSRGSRPASGFERHCSTDFVYTSSTCISNVNKQAFKPHRKTRWLYPELFPLPTAHAIHYDPLSTPSTSMHAHIQPAESSTALNEQRAAP